MKKPIVGIVIGLVMVGLFLFFFFKGLELYNAETTKNSESFISVGYQEEQESGLQVISTIQSVDPLKGEIVVRLEFTPLGKCADESGRPAYNIYVTTNSDTGVIVLKKGEWLNASFITLRTYDGVVSRYPFDRHKADIDLTAYMIPVGKTEDDAEAVPMYMELGGVAMGFGLNFMPIKVTEENKDYEVGVTITVERSFTTRAVAMFVMVMLWLMSLAVVTITLSVAVWGRKLEFGSFAWIGAMLFAFFSFRSAAPGIPPIGGYFDFLSFFWALMLVACCLVTLVITYVKRAQ